jgi:hypothetical protein
LAILALTGSSSSHYRAVGAERTTSRPQLSIEMNAIQLRAGGSFTLTVLVEDQEGADTVFFTPLKWGILGGLNLRVRDARSGDTVEPRNMDDSIIGPNEALDRKSYARIPRGMFIGTRRTEKVDEYFPVHGRYFLDVAYLCPLTRTAAPVEDFWSSEKGVLYSNTLGG